MADKIHDIALKHYEQAKDFWDEIYERGRLDLDFLYGDQWDGYARNIREREGRVCLQENRLLSMVNMVCNQIRQASPVINVRPVDEAADVQTADIINDLVRSIQYVSDAESIYDTASRNAISASIGWIRICTEYADYDTFDQEIKLERILNPFAAYLDPISVRQDGSDAEYCFVFDEMPREVFEEKYPDIDPDSFEDRENWLDTKENTVKIAEYFYKDYEEFTLVQTASGTYKKGDQPEEEEILDSRKSKKCSIKYAKITSNNVLEEGDFPGELIPLVPVLGLETQFNNRRHIFSMIHAARDPQMYFNYMKSASAEILALQPKAPFIGFKGQFSSTPEKWSTANLRNYAFLEADVIYDKNNNALPPPQRQPVPQGSTAMFNEMVSAADGMKATLGIYDPSLGNVSNEVSGKAIIARQVNADNANFHFIDNLAVALRQVGRVIVGLIPYIYNDQRMVRVIGEDKSERLIPVNQGVVRNGNEYRKAQIGEVATDIVDLRAGKYDVVINVGSSYSTRRQEAANAIIEIARIKPEILDLAGDVLIDSLDVPNAQELAKRVRAVMDPAILADDVEAQRLQAMSQSLQQMQQRLEQTEAALLAKQNNEQFKNEIDARKVQIDQQKVEIEALKAMADIKKTEAETQNINVDTYNDMQTMMDDMRGRIDEVGDVIEIMLDRIEQDSVLNTA